VELLLIYAVTLAVAVLISGRAERTVLSTAVLFLVVGIVTGNSGLHIINFKPESSIVYYVAQIALFSVLFTDAMRLAPDHLREGRWRLPFRALLIGLPLGIIVTAVLAHFLARLPWLESFLIGAVLSPTDPVFAAAMFRFQDVPARLQRLLNVESGLNDGLALPIIIFLLSRMGDSPESTLSSIGEMALGLVIGAAISWIFVKIIRFSFFDSSDLYRPLAGVSIALLIYGISEMMHANTYLAAFSGGFTIAAISEKATKAFQKFGELVTELLKLAALLVFGSVLTRQIFSDVGLLGFIFCVLALVVARPASLAIALFGAQLSRREWLAAAWFGPKGFASVVYGLLILRAGFAGSRYIGHLVAITVCLSIVAHSSTDIVVARWFQKPDANQKPSPPSADAHREEYRRTG
jgi:sodium/hydrogen antiporter